MEVENFIAGNFVSCRRLISSYDPSTGSEWAKIPDSGKLEVDSAVAAAVRAFPSWSSLPVPKRCSYLLRVADILEQRLDEFAEAESRDQGKPIWIAKTIDIPRAIENFRHFAQTVPHTLGTSKVHGNMDAVSYVTHSPVGVAGLISPWNLPLYLLTFKMAPALACGNTIVAKPSEMTSVTAYMLCKLFVEIGLPPGVVNMVFGTGKSTGEPLVCHPDVPLISFTGSTTIGKLIAEKTAPLFKKLSLEMGGKNASLVFEDCDLSKAVETHLRSSFINSGQVCLCTSRIFVQKSIYKEFLKEFINKTVQLKVGPPSKEGVFMGPLNSKQHFDKVQRYLQFATEDGGTIECGETIEKVILAKENCNGYFMPPTIISGLTDEARCMKEEIFGPVTCVVPFDTEDEVIERANNSNYGLCATVWSSNLSTANRVAQKLQAGTVWINCWLYRDMDLPFGGVKSSGIGREGTADSFDFYTEKKTICSKI